MQELSNKQQIQVLLVARVWQLEHDKSPSSKAEQLAVRAQALLLELQMAGVACSACSQAACEALSQLDSSGHLAAAFRPMQQQA